MDNKVMAFIDGSNFYHALKEARGHARIDFAQLVNGIVGQRRLITLGLPVL
jgi:hypothetical protein